MTEREHPKTTAAKRKERKASRRPVKEVVNNPTHYQIEMYDIDGRPVTIETVDLIEALFPHNSQMAHAMTYLCRAGKKEGNELKQELGKAQWWIRRAVDFLGGHPSVPPVTPPRQKK